MQRTRVLYAVLAMALALSSAGLPAATAAVTVSWDLNPEPEVVGYVVYIGNEPGCTPSGSTSATPRLTCSRRHGGAAVLLRGLRLLRRASRRGAILRGVHRQQSGADPRKPGRAESRARAALSLALSALDPEGAMLTFSATGLPRGWHRFGDRRHIRHADPGRYLHRPRHGLRRLLSASQSFTWTIGSSPPAAPTLVKPSGAVATTTPTFEWESVATATSYRLWVDDASSVNPRVQVDLTPTRGWLCHRGRRVPVDAGGDACRRRRLLVGPRVERRQAPGPGAARWISRCRTAGRPSSQSPRRRHRPRSPPRPEPSPWPAPPVTTSAWRRSPGSTIAAGPARLPARRHGACRRFRCRRARTSSPLRRGTDRTTSPPTC